MASIVSGLIEKVEIVEGNSSSIQSIASTAYAYCTASASDQIKNIEMTGFKLQTGVTIHVKFEHANTASNPKIKFNSEADNKAKAIVQYGSTAAGDDENTDGWHDGAVLTLTYDGTNWVRDQGYNTSITTSSIDPHKVFAGPASGSTANTPTFRLLNANDIPELSWTKITSNLPTTLSGYGITDANIANGVITLGANTITPVTEVNGHSGSSVTVTAGDLGLAAALRFIGVTTSTMSDGFTGVPAGINNYTIPIVGDVVIDSSSDSEYVCISTASSTYTWERLGRDGSWSLSDHTHGNITNTGLLGAANRLVITDNTKEITTSSHYANSTQIAINSTSVPTENFYVNGTVKLNLGSSDGTSDQSFLVQGSSKKLSIGSDGLQAYGSSSTVASLYLQQNGGDIQIGSSTTGSATRTFYGLFEFPTSGGFNYSGISTSSTNAAVPIWFSSASNALGIPVYSTDFKFNPDTNTLTIDTGTLTATNYSGNAATATAFASAQTVYVDLETNSTATTITGGSNSAEILGVSGVLPVINGGTGASTYSTDGVILVETTNNVKSFVARAYSDSSSSSALSNSSTNFVTERDVYYGLPTINNIHNYDSSSTLFAPTTAGTQYQLLVASGSNTAPTWASAALVESNTSSTNSTNAYTILTLGNNASVSSSNEHSEGKIILYSSGTNAHVIVGSATSTSNYTHTLPNADGVLLQAASSSAVGSNTQPIYIAANGVATALTYVPNRLYYSAAAEAGQTNSTSFTATSHYASDTQIGLGTTSMPSGSTDTLYVNGTTKHNGAIYLANNTTYWIDNSAAAYLSDLRVDKVQVDGSAIKFFASNNATGTQYAGIDFDDGYLNFTRYNSGYGFNFDGTIVPNANNTYNIGSSSYKWANIYATTFTGALTGNADTATNATNDSDGNAINSTYLKKSGGTMTGTLTVDGVKGTIDVDYGATLPLSPTEGQIFFQISDPWFEIPTGGTTGQALIKHSNIDRDVEWGAVGGIMSPTTTTTYYVSGSSSTTENADPALFDTSIYVSGSVLFGAAWNDYAEYRQCTEIIEPGRCIIENGDGTLSLSTKRLQAGAEIVSDTFGFAIGQTESCNTPIAVSGRVLAYMYEPIEQIKIGAPVCSGPNGTVSQMTSYEARKYPWLIIGTVSSIPQEEEWGAKNVKVKNRIWIRVR